MNVLLIVLLTLSLIFNVIFLILRENAKQPDGLLNVDTRDPEKDYYDFVFLIPTGDIPKKRYLTVEVHTKSGISPGGEFDENF